MGNTWTRIEFTYTRSSTNVARNLALKHIILIITNAARKLVFLCHRQTQNSTPTHTNTQSRFCRILDHVARVPRSTLCVGRLPGRIRAARCDLWIWKTNRNITTDFLNPWAVSVAVVRRSERNKFYIYIAARDWLVLISLLFYSQPKKPTQTIKTY